MKKLITIMGALALSVCAQAAAVDWKVTATSAEVGYSVYLMVGDTATTSWDSVDAIATAAVSTGKIANDGRAYVASGTATDVALTKSGSFYYVVVTSDASRYAVSDVYSGAKYVYDNDNVAKPPESAPSTFPTFAANSASYSEFASVPEPTSSLLMLLGVAGLALKRKHV